MQSEFKFGRLLVLRFIISLDFASFTRILFLIHFLYLISHSATSEIPGCANIEQLKSVDLNVTSPILLCFCDVKKNDRISIRCTYGSNLNDLITALNLTSKLNAIVDEIIIEHMEFNETGIPENFFDLKGVILQSLSIKSCNQQYSLAIHQAAFNKQESNIKEILLIECNLQEFPGAIRHLSNLEKLSLAQNKIISIEFDNFASFSKLRELDISGNFLSSLKSGTFSMVKNTLETLIIGEHNYMNNSALDEIGTLYNLKVLDLSKADGISAFANETFINLKKLEKLFLLGCNLQNITKETFRGLKNLRELDLRINLIENIECGGFEELSALKKISLGGNFLNSTEKCLWMGMESLEELDLGWNEIKTIKNDSFSTIGRNLLSLDLRHNMGLLEVEDGAFKKLEKLISLNLSNTAIKNINLIIFSPLVSLKFLNLSQSAIEEIEDGSLNAQAKSLEKLILSGNKIRSLSSELLQNLKNLRYIDLSNNKWICDEKIKDVIRVINMKYKESAIQNRDFIFVNANETICDRPYSLQGEIITDVPFEYLIIYDENFDTTTANSFSTIANSDNGTDPDELSLIKLFKIGNIIGDEEDVKNTHKQNSSRTIPLYNIDESYEIVEKSEIDLKIIFAASIAFLLVTVAIILAILDFIKKKNDSSKMETEFAALRTKSENAQLSVNNHIILKETVVPTRISI